MSFTGVLNAFEAECRAAHAALTEAGDDALELPTPCPPWNVKQLIVHVAVGVSRLPDMLEEAAGANNDGRGRIDDAIQVADRFGSVDMVSAFLEEGWRRTAAAAASAGGSAVVAVDGEEITVQDYMLTRVVEVTAHGRDLARALGRDPWTSPEALALSRPFLVKRLGEEPPVELGWDDADFFDLATGRRRLNEDEQAALGELARRFPVFS